MHCFCCRDAICSSVEVKGHDEEGKGGQAGDEPEEEAMKKKKTQLKLHLVCKFLAFAESLCLTFSEYLRFLREGTTQLQFLLAAFHPAHWGSCPPINPHTDDRTTRRSSESSDVVKHVWPGLAATRKKNTSINKMRRKETTSEWHQLTLSRVVLKGNNV